MSSGTPLAEGYAKGTGLLIIRGVSYFSLLIVCFILDAALKQSAENIKLRENLKLNERQLGLQREQYEKFMENEKAIKTMRHDMRQHFNVIKKLADEGKVDGIKEYFKDLMNSIKTSEDVFYCENSIVNALCAHYLELAKAEGIALDTQFDIPQHTGSVPAIDLCIILGNILENAIEACRRMQASGMESNAIHGEKFIKLRSLYRSDNGTLAFVVENSFDGICTEKNGVFISRKDDEQKREGVGLSSIQAACKKHGGFANFEYNGFVWCVSAIVKTVE